MRISERHRYLVSDRRINKARSDNVHVHTQLSTQKRINTLHDDPISFAQSIKLREKLSDIESFKSNLNFTKGFIEVTETAISSIHELLSRAHELSLAMANDSYDATSRKATAQELKEIMNQVIQLGNSKYNGKYVFSGFRTLSPALDGDGNYLGDDGSIFLQVGSDNFKKVNVSGREFFEASLEEKQAGHFDMLDAFDLFRTGLEHNDKEAIYKSVEELSYHMDKASSFQAGVGAVWSAVGEISKRLEFEADKKLQTISELEDADIYKTASDFKRTESVLQSTLLASNKLLQPSLLNFMQ